MTSSEMSQALRKENELFIAVCNKIEDASSLFLNEEFEVVSYETLDDNAIFTVIA